MWQGLISAVVAWWSNHWEAVVAYYAGMEAVRNEEVKQQRDAMGRFIVNRPDVGRMSRLEKLEWLRKRGLLRDDGSDKREHE